MTRRLPALIGLAALAFALTLVPGGVWTALLAVNLRASPSVPWAAVAMVALLWLLWSYLAGKGPPSRTSAARQGLLRAARLPPRRFAWAVVAGLLGLCGLAGLWIVLVQLFGAPGHALPDFSRYPGATVAISLIVASILGGVTEEAGFRGYLQGPLEARVGGPAAVLIVAAAMAPAHMLTQGFVLATLVFYLLVDVMLGVSAWLTGSIVPGIVVHGVGLLAFFTLLWPRDASRRPFAGGGAGSWFWIHAAQAAVFGVLAVLAFRRLAREAARPVS